MKVTIEYNASNSANPGMFCMPIQEKHPVKVIEQENTINKLSL
jgi:hypothetical protein